MSKRTFIKVAIAVLLLLVPVLLVSCGDSDAPPDQEQDVLSQADVEAIVRSELADVPAPSDTGPSLDEIEQRVMTAIAGMPAPDPGLTRGEVEDIVQSAIAGMPAPDPGLTRGEVEEIVQSAIAGMPAPDPGLTGDEVEDIVLSVLANIQKPEETDATTPDKEVYEGPAPPKHEPAKYTQYFVKEAIGKYESEGLGETIAYYNTQESIDGQWYMFILDENDMMLAHAANPSFVGLPASEVDGPNAYPAGEVVVATADEDGEWSSYNFINPVSGAAETKHSWTVVYDGLTFGSGWYESGVSKSDNPAYTQAFVQQAISLYDALGRQATIAYYSTTDSVDGQWYAFIVDESGYTIAHHNPMFRNRDPSLRVDSAGYFYGDDLLSATEAGRWVDYVLLNPETGDERQKHTWAVLHGGLIFASGWYE